MEAENIQTKPAVKNRKLSTSLFDGSAALGDPPLTRLENNGGVGRRYEFTFQGRQRHTFSEETCMRNTWDQATWPSGRFARSIAKIGEAREIANRLLDQRALPDA